MPPTHCVYLALGANLGERRANLKEALRSLSPQVEVEAVSRLYETAPAYVENQPNFLNIAAKAQTSLKPGELLTYLKQLEQELGRTKKLRFGPRLIDLDIIFYDDLALERPGLTIPHPRLTERAFVLYPLLDIAPDFVHPVLQKPVRELAAQLDGEEDILRVIDWTPLAD